MFVIIDASSLGYRAWHSPPINEFKSVPDEEEEVELVGGLFLYAFCNQLVKIIKHVDMTRPKFSKILVCWDGKNSIQGRCKLYPPYKQSRNKERDPRKFITPRTFINLARTEISKVSPRMAIYDENSEADDLIAALCDLLEFEDTCIVSRDKDMFQLITETTKVFDPFQPKWYSPKDVEKEFGVRPDQIVEYKAVVGDSSDNYPGIKGMGPKRGVELLNSTVNYDVTNKEVDIFRRIATIPFEDFDNDKFLTMADSLEWEDICDWQPLIDKWEFNHKFSLSLYSVV